MSATSIIFQSTAQSACFVNQTADEYHADTSRVSRSELVTLIKSTWQYFKRHVERAPLYQQKETDSFEFGTLFHAAVLELKPVHTLAHVIPDEVLNVDGHRKGGKWLAWKNCHDDKPCYKPQELLIPEEMLRSVMSSQAAMDLLSGDGRNEQTIHWQYGSIPCRTRVDRLKADCIVDLKTARSCDLNSINNSLEYDEYYKQAALYQMAVEAVTGDTLPFHFIFVEKVDPFRTVVVELGDHVVRIGREEVRTPWIDKGREEIEAAFRLLQKCADSGNWRDPIGDSVIKMDRPKSADYKWTLTESE